MIMFHSKVIMRLLSNRGAEVLVYKGMRFMLILYFCFRRKACNANFGIAYLTSLYTMANRNYKEIVANI